jgi:hypothetical protein
MINDKSYFWFLYWVVLKCPNVSEEHINSIFKVNELSSSGCKHGGEGMFWLCRTSWQPAAYFKPVGSQKTAKQCLKLLHKFCNFPKI